VLDTPDDIEIEPLEADAAEGGDIDVGGSQRWRTVALGAGIAAAVVAAAVAVGSAGGDERTAPTSTTPPTTQPARTTTSPAPVTTTSTLPEIRPGRGPLATGVVTGAVLHVVTLDGHLLRIDADTGVIRSREIEGWPRLELAVIPGAGGVLLTPGSGAARWYPDDPDAEPVALSFSDGELSPAADPALVWLAQWGWSESSYSLVRAADGGRAGPPLQVPRQADVLGDDGTGGLLLRAPGGTYRMAPDGTVRQESRFPALGWSARVLVVLACDEQLACEWRRVDRASGQVTGGCAVCGDDLGPGPGALSPGERYLTASRYDDQSSSLVVVDLDTGERTVVQDFGTGGWRWPGPQLSWAPQGDALFYVDPDGHLQVWWPGRPGGAEDLHSDVVPLVQAMAVGARPGR
jgi:hypothetical protein